MKVDIIGIPIDLGADRRGVDMGPSAIRYADLNEKLRALGHEVVDLGSVPVPNPESRTQGDPKLKYLEQIVASARDLGGRVRRGSSHEYCPMASSSSC